MKRAFFIIIISVSWIHFLTAQDTTAISFMLSDSTIQEQYSSYTARDDIDLTAGFYRDGVYAPITFSIDESLIFPIQSGDYVLPENIENREIDTTLDFGSLPGSFNVSSTGAATYNVPMYIPPGVRGATPSLSVIYNSSNQDGLLGVGWSLSGTSTIHRMGKNFFEDDSVVDGIHLDTTDLLAIDGNRLVLKSGNYGQENSTYGTKFESFRTIQAYGTTGNGPSWFIVTDNRGYEYEYGNSTDSKIHLTGKTSLLGWKLNKVTDPNGNFIIYEYDNSVSGKAYLTGIKYSGNENASIDPYNEIKILYQEREDNSIKYLLGAEINDAYLVRKIQSFADDVKLREYQFNYSFDRRTFLSEIIEKNQYGDRYNSTIIGWNEFADTIIKDNTLDFAYNEMGKFADFDGDGYSDYIVYNGGGIEFYLLLYLNEGNGDFTSVSESYTIDREEYVDHFTGDFNGDGYSDVVIVSVETCSWLNPRDELKTEEYYKYTFLSGPNLELMGSYSYSSCSGYVSKPLPFQYSISGPQRFFAEDINGDSFTDFVTIDNDAGMIILGNENGSNFASRSISLTSSNKENIVADFTGDGLPDFAVYQSDYIKIYQYLNDELTLSDSTGIFILGDLKAGDFNGDGLMDLYYEKYSNEWYTRLCTGEGFADETEMALQPLASIDYFTMVLDFNRDGRDDIVGFLNPDNEGWLIHYHESIGDNTFFVKSLIEGTLDLDFLDTKMGDINGDGNMDLIAIDEEAALLINPNNKHHLVKSIENGMGIRTTINYNILNAMSGSNYVQNGSYSFPLQSIGDPLTVVESYEITSTLHDSALISASEFWYTDAVVHQQGLGFLGFKSIETKVDSVHSTKIENSFTEPDFYAFTDSVETYYNGNLISSVQNQKEYLTKNLTGGNSYLIYSDSTIAYDALNENYRVTDPTYDSQGNLTGSRTTFDDGSYQEVLYYNYLGDGSQFPQRMVKNVKHKDDNVFSTETRITYDTVNYQVTQIIENYGKSNEITTDLSQYDDFGNPGKVEVQPDGLSKLTVTYNYDATGRFQVSKTTPLGEVSYQYDEIQGRLLSEEDIYGNQVTYEYNNWGAVEKTISPFGLSKTVTRNWAGVGAPAGALYYVHSVDTLGTYSKQYVDYKGRSFKSENEGFGGQAYFSETKYNLFNQINSSSNLYSDSAYRYWNTFTYRTNDGRISNESYIGGAQVEYSYSANQLEKTINSTRDYTYEFDALGNVTSVEDPVGNSLSYSYNSTGSYKSIVGNGGTLTNVYNDAGIDTVSVDPSLGTVQQSVNALGQPTWIKDGKGNEFEFTYDNLNRLTRKENANNATEYYTVSYVVSGNGIGQVDSMSYTNGVLTTTLSYTYDSIGRVRTESKQIGSKTHALSYAYDAFGRLDSVTDANGRKFDYRYDSRGYMNKLYFEGALVWELAELDLSERTENLGANISVTKSFNVYGQLASIEAADLFDMSYSFDTLTGNLNWRKQRIFDEGGSCIDTLAEYFSYDSLDRLTQIIGPNDTLRVTFDTGIKERIDSKTDAGADYIYSALNKFQLESIDSATNALTDRPDMHISYTSFNKVDTISEGEYLLTFDYGPNQERVRMKVSRNDTLQYTRYYFGSYEVTEYAGGGYEKDTWLSAGGGAFGFHRETATTDSIYYLIKDHLGSVMAVAGEDGTAREFFSYDAWGRRRNATDWTYDSTLTTQYTARGYTGHEHMDETCLINMNGRVYDPIVGLFLSPDPVIQEPMNPLNYNRYTYVLNNPLKYTDPSGYLYSNKQIEWENSWSEGEAMYYAMAEIYEHVMELNVRRSYSERINNMHNDPDGYSYDEDTDQYYYRGERASHEEAIQHAIEPNVSETWTFNYLEVSYFMLDDKTALANIYYEKSSVNGGNNIDSYFAANGGDPTRINPYSGPIVDQIIGWMRYIRQESPDDLYLPHVVSSYLFKNPYNGEPNNLSKMEGKVKYFITNPLTSPVYYDRWPIVEVSYDPYDLSISIFLQGTDTNQYRGNRVIYIQSTDSDLIWDYWEIIRN